MLSSTDIYKLKSKSPSIALSPAAYDTLFPRDIQCSQFGIFTTIHSYILFCNLTLFFFKMYFKYRIKGSWMEGTQDLFYLMYYLCNFS